MEKLCTLVDYSSHPEEGGKEGEKTPSICSLKGKGASLRALLKKRGRKRRSGSTSKKEDTAISYSVPV